MDDDGEVIESVTTNRVVMGTESVKTTQTTIPFVKNNEFDYAWFTGGNRVATWILYVLVAIFVVTAGIERRQSHRRARRTGFGRFGADRGGAGDHLLGHIVYADYLDDVVYPRFGRTGGLRGCLAGALIGFLWYNSFPAQTFMGDTGSLAIGGIIAVFAYAHPPARNCCCRYLAACFLSESFGYDTGFLFQIYQTPLQQGTTSSTSPSTAAIPKKGIFETKIVIRFWIVSMLLSLAALATLSKSDNQTKKR